MNLHHKTLNKIPIGLHIQHALSPAMLTGQLSMPQQQRHLANVKMCQFCGGNANYMRISHSHPKPSSTMKTRDLSSCLFCSGRSWPSYRQCSWQRLLWCCKWHSMYNAFIGMGLCRGGARGFSSNYKIHTRPGDRSTNSTWSHHHWCQSPSRNAMA